MLLAVLLLVGPGCCLAAAGSSSIQQHCPSNWTVGADVDCCNLAQSGPHTQVSPTAAHSTFVRSNRCVQCPRQSKFPKVTVYAYI